MARYNDPSDRDDPSNYSESDPTQYANYGGTSGEAYSEYSSPVQPRGYGQTPPPRTPWHQKPATLIGLGVLTAAILALLVYAVVKFVSPGASSPAGTSATSSPAASSSAPAPSTTESAAPAPAPSTQTITESPTAPSTITVTPTTTTTEAPVTTTTTTTVAPTPSTTTSISTSVTTVTETTTKRLWPTIPTFPSPTLYQPPGQ